ncbi:hypothetical protein JZ751_011398 [Albula glossodonta]|uniref:peptide-methionine (S)-S-oxide reductase n=1 Tax=Albula glossodonta TaxID=121402 RepID=A0A8T2N4V2_9TELE|nr:hypothetical protein JZ751_011398 [Albula glossodonta]
MVREMFLQAEGLTGHTEVVRVVYYPEEASYEKLLKVFWESHDPTQGSPPPHPETTHPTTNPQVPLPPLLIL